MGSGFRGVGTELIEEEGDGTPAAPAALCSRWGKGIFLNSQTNQWVSGPGSDQRVVALIEGWRVYAL